MASVPDRPEVWVNCAASADGRIAFRGGLRARLSSPEDLRRVHTLRSQVDGIVVGVGTVILDDPSLGIRWERIGQPPGPPPHRIVVDGSGRTPPGARVLDGSQPTTVATTSRSRRTFPEGVRTIVAGTDRVDFGQLFAALRAAGMRRLLVEGGAQVLATVLGERRFDRLTVYYAPTLLGDAGAPPIVARAAASSFDSAIPLTLEGVAPVGEGYVASYIPAPVPR